MRISFNSPHFLISVLVMSCCIFTACGGGGSGNKQPTNQSSFNSSVTASSTATTSSAIAQDTIPEAFSFTPKTDVAVNTEYTSNTITVKGIDIAVPVSITGGSYSINSGDFTSAVGTVSAGQTITVKTTSGSKTEASTAAVLTIGGLTGTFTVTTVNDTFAPVSEFKFPTPYTMSEANQVKVRGTATDDNAITEVKLVVRSFNLATPDVTISTKDVTAVPKYETNGVKDFSSWTATIPLTANAENEIKVVATDDRNNRILVVNAKNVTVRQADRKSAFPDEVNPFRQTAQALVLDKNNGRNRLLGADTAYESSIIYAVNLDTGIRTPFIQYKNNEECERVNDIILDSINSKLYAFCNSPQRKLLEYQLNSGELENTYIAPADIAPAENDIHAMALDRNNGRNQIVFAPDTSRSGFQNNSAVHAFHLDTKTFSIISAIENQQIRINEARHIAINGDQYLLPSAGEREDDEARELITVDAITGSRSVLSRNIIDYGELFTASMPDRNVYHQTLGIYVQSERDRILVSESSGKIFAIDLTTGYRTLVKQLSYGSINEGTLPRTADIEVDIASDIAFIDDGRYQAILIFDLETQEKVILSKSKNDF